jgi:beta-1,4-mannosyltransferase
MKKVGVFVYGDIGRSPRMQNHALELSKDHQVYFMGYFDTPPRSSVLENPNIKIIDLQINHLQFFRKVSFYLYALVRIILQIIQIIYFLGFKHRNLEFVLVQVSDIRIRTHPRSPT